MKLKKLWHKKSGNPANPCLVFLHGFMGTHHDFSEVIKYLSQDFLCIAFDLPGHGNSKEMIPSDAHEFNEMILRALEPYLKSKTTLIGYSMGGRILVQLQKQIKQNLLVLISSRIKPLSEKEKEKTQLIYKSLLDSLKQECFINFLEKWYRLPLFKTLKNKSECYQKMMSERKKENPQMLAHILSLLSPVDYSPRPQFLSKLKTPLLYICGKEDEKYTHLMKEIHSEKKDAWLYNLSDTSHALHLEDPLNTALIIKQFHRYYYD